MRFQDWKKEAAAHHDEAERLEKMMGRRVVIRDEADDQLVLNMRAIAWGPNEDQVSFSFTLSHDRMGFIHDPLTELTANELLRVVQIKTTVERWAAGLLTSLPQEL